MANGVPGLEVRMPLLFSHGVLGGRMSIERFVALTSTNHARTYGLYPRKGTIAVGADADIAIWDPERRVTISSASLHDAVGYTPYEGHQVRGWPDTVISRGRLVIRDARLHAARGSGRFIARSTPEPVLRQRLTGNPNAIVRKYFQTEPRKGEQQ